MPDDKHTADREPGQGPELDDTLRLLVDLADAFQTKKEGSGREPIYAFTLSGGLQLQHGAFDATKWPGVDEQMLDTLAGQGLIRTEWISDSSTAIHVTDAGIKVAADARRFLEGKDPEGEPVDLDWDTIAQPTLRAAYESWTGLGAPSDGVLTLTIAEKLGEDKADSTMKAIRMLTAAGYLERASVLSTEFGPAAATVTPLGLEAVGGWPATTGEAAAAALLAALDKEIEETDDEGTKTRLEELRQSAKEVGQNVLTSVLTRVLTDGI